MSINLSRITSIFFQGLLVTKNCHANFQEPCTIADNSPNQISAHLLQSSTDTIQDKKIKFLQNILLIALQEKSRQHQSQWLRQAAMTKLANYQSGWRFFCCFWWKPTTQTSLYLLELAHLIEHVTPLDHALKHVNYRHTHFHFAPTAYSDLDYDKAHQATVVITLRLP